jgi:hypothetical protein
MKNHINYKPGTSKVLSPRSGNYSVRWGRLVLINASLNPDDKTIKKKVVELWTNGYSHKDAANILIEYYRS